jgi:hypothetical protein
MDFLAMMSGLSGPRPKEGQSLDEFLRSTEPGFVVVTTDDEDFPDEFRDVLEVQVLGYRETVRALRGDPERVFVPIWTLVPKKERHLENQRALADDFAPARPRGFGPPICPVQRHPPTYEEWLESLPWMRMRPEPPKAAPDAPLREIRIVGYRDVVTTKDGTPVRVRHELWEFVPTEG